MREVYSIMMVVKWDIKNCVESVFIFILDIMKYVFKEGKKILLFFVVWWNGDVVVEIWSC